MKKVGLFTLAAMALITGGVINAHQVSADTEQQPSEEKFDTRIFRIYNPNTGEHLLTPSGWEIVVLEKEGWKLKESHFMLHRPNLHIVAIPLYNVYIIQMQVTIIIQQVILKS